MHTFGRIENPESWCDEVEVLETARHAERENCVSGLREEGRERLEDLRSKLADAKYELAVINSPILILPYEVMAEIFNWHLLMGGTMMTILLICKRWATVAYSSPRLWSRIAVGDRCLGQLRLQGAIRCGDLDILRAVLSRARSSPLQLELSWFNFDTDHDHPVPPTTLRWGPLASSNWVTALALILDNQVLKRCTYFVLAAYEDPVPAALMENLSVLPLLSSIYIDKNAWSKYGFQLIRSLVKVSPSLRHVRCHRSSLGPQDLGEGEWMKGIESYGWIDLSKPWPLLYETRPFAKSVSLGNRAFSERYRHVKYSGGRCQPSPDYILSLLHTYILSSSAIIFKW